MYQAVAATAARVPDDVAWDFLDTTSTYRAFLAAIDRCANALAALGLAAGERILISMPTSPQGVIAFYAANKLGAVPALIHPLSTAPEIEYYLNASRARIALTLDAFYERFAAVKPKLPLQTLILARIPDYLSPLKKFGFWLTKGRKIAQVPADARVRWWGDLMAAPSSRRRRAALRVRNDPAAILFSGGTTGMPKGILLSNRNFIAEGMQAAAWGRHGTRTFDSRDPADIPRFRPGRVRERRVHGGRQIHPGADVQCRDCGETAAREAAQSAGGRAHAV